MKVRKGFTLVEMMVVVAILAILLSVAAPGFQTFIQNTKIRTTAESFHAGLNLARTEALRRNTRVSLWIVDNLAANCARSNTGTSWVVSVDNPASACNAAASSTTSPRLIQSYRGTEGSDNVTIRALDGAGGASSCITFNGFGAVEAACTGAGAPIATIEVRSTASTRALDLRRTGGAIRMCDPVGGNYTSCS